MDEIMSLNNKDVLHAAKLARLKVEGSKLDNYVAQLSQVFDWVGKLQEIKSKVQPLANPLEDMVQEGTPLRQDVATDGNCPEVVLKNGPQIRDDFFVVPKVVE